MRSSVIIGLVIGFTASLAVGMTKKRCEETDLAKLRGDLLARLSALEAKAKQALG